MGIEWSRAFQRKSLFTHGKVFAQANAKYVNPLTFAAF